MYRLLAVDDDVISMESIRSVVQRDLSGIFELETARSGLEAIEKADKFEPDLVLADITLLGASGIEVVREIKASHPHTLFVVTSAYEQYHYAREVMALGVVDFFVKPISRQRMTQTLLRIIEMIDREKKKYLQDVERKEKLEVVQPALEHGFINSIMFSEAPLPQLEYHIKLLGLTDAPGCMMTLVVGTSQEAPNDQVNWNVRCQYYYASIRDAFRAICPCVVGPVILNHMAIYVQLGEMDSDAQVIDLAQSLVEQINTLVQTSCRLAIGGRVEELSHLRKSYEESLHALRMNNLAVPHISMLPVPKPEGEYPHLMEERLVEHLSSGQKQQAYDVLTMLFKWIRHNHPGDTRYLRARITEAMVQLKRAAMGCGAEDDGPAYLYSLDELEDADALLSFCMNQIAKLCEVVAKQRDMRLSSTVRKTRAFIEENYQNDLTLDTIVKESGVSMHYLSRIFKEEMGISIMEVLGLTRINKARTLLEEGRLTVREVGTEVGYSDPNYFSRIFKKYVGTTPTDYRDSLQGSNS